MFDWLFFSVTVSFHVCRMVRGSCNFILSFSLILTPIDCVFYRKRHLSPHYIFATSIFHVFCLPTHFFCFVQRQTSQNIRAQIKKVYPKLYAYLNSEEKEKKVNGIENLFFFCSRTHVLSVNSRFIRAATGTQKIHCIKLWQSQLIVRIACYVNEFAEIDLQHDEERKKKKHENLTKVVHYNHWYRA